MRTATRETSIVATFIVPMVTESMEGRYVKGKEVGKFDTEYLEQVCCHYVYSWSKLKLCKKIRALRERLYGRVRACVRKIT